MTSRILVLADTHMPSRAHVLPKPVLALLPTADLVIHLGDFTDPSLLHFLAGEAPVAGVYGNNDPPELRMQLPLTQEVAVSGRRLRLLHGHVGGRTALAAARVAEGADAVLFGHSHQPHHSWENGRLLFNPGSPTDRRWARHASFGLLEIDDAITARIVSLP